jgi:hypothetical protein
MKINQRESVSPDNEAMHNGTPIRNLFSTNNHGQNMSLINPILFKGI